MLNKIVKRISDTNGFKDYAARRCIIDTVMIITTTEYAKSLTICSEEEITKRHKKSFEATEIRNKFCNRHIVYTKIYDYLFKKGLEES